MKEKVLVSACLLGEKCRYDGNDNLVNGISLLQEKYELISICPEVLGGLSIPRIPCEIKDEKVIGKNGQDYTKNFEIGANIALEIVDKYKIRFAVLKSNSPSCGHLRIYNGDFNKTLIDGNGIFSKLLIKQKILIFNENNYKNLL